MTRSPTKTGSACRRTSGSNGVTFKTTPLRRALLSGVAVCICSGPALATDPTLPTGGVVASGDVAITQPGTNTMVITQGSNTAVVNWDSFSIGAQAHVDFRQPGQDSAILNRVTGSTGTEILGRLTANGQVHIVNPNGIFIGPNGTVNSQGFVASTLDISDDDFNAGRLHYRGNGNAATVTNAGRVTIGRGGYAALLGGRVRNSGVVTVPMGRIGFASGERVTLDLSGDQFLQVALPTGDDADDGLALIDHSGTASAEGGLIEMRAATAREAVRQAVNLSGVAEARSVSMHNGTIVLGGGAGGTVTVSGQVSTRSTSSALAVEESLRPRSRPQISITGEQIVLEGADIDASHVTGDGLVRIGGDFAGQGDLQRATSVDVDSETVIRADALQAGNGGRIAIWSDETTTFYGSVSAQGGAESGDGGFIEVSAKQFLTYGGLANTRASFGSWGTLLLDPTDITIDAGAGGEDALEASLDSSNVTLTTEDAVGSDAGDITINADINWTSATTLTLDADNDVLLNAAIDAPSGGLTIFTGGDIVAGWDGSGAALGHVEVADFLLMSGSWQQIGAAAAGSGVAYELPRFSADNFALSGSADFIRGVGDNGYDGTLGLVDIYGLQGLSSGYFNSDEDDPTVALLNDIDASGTSGWSRGDDGTGFEPITNWNGTFDGGGFTISDLEMDSQEPSEGPEPAAAGLFTTISSDATVSDLRISNATIAGSAGGVLAATNDGTIRNVRIDGGSTLTTLGQSTGGMVGVNYGTIEDSFTDVAVTANIDNGSTYQDIGGFVGENYGLINRSHALGDVTVTNATDNLIITAGGFVGYAEDSEGSTSGISDSYARGNVDVTSTGGDAVSVQAAGFAGWVDDTIQHSYSTGSVTTSGDAVFETGGFAAVEYTAGVLVGNFWDTTTSGLSSSAGGDTGLTTAQFQDTTGFIALGEAEGWDFDTVWAPGDSGYYPVNYTTTAVVFAQPDTVTVQYGQTSGATTTGSVAGGPGSYVFGESDDTLDTTAVFESLTFADENAGNTTFTLATGSVTSDDGVTYRVVDLETDATITRAPLVITADDQVKLEGETFEFDGTEFSVSGLVVEGDSVDSVELYSYGTDVEVSAEDSPFEIYASEATGEGLDNYDITFVDGEFVVTNGGDTVPRPPVIVDVELPNPTDSFSDDDSVIVGDVASVSSGTQSALDTLDTVQGLSDGLIAKTDSCGQSGGDVGRYLACLSDALSDFAGEMDAISNDLPPGMENVAQIIRTARSSIDQVRTRTEQRLAGATSDAERDAIRRDAITEAQSALTTASGEIRKAITLVRADDPELAAIQRQTILTVADAVDTVGLQLSRVADL